MIVYNRLWETMKARDISQYKLIKDYKISAGQLDRLRKNENISSFTLNQLCRILRGILIKLNCRAEYSAWHLCCSSVAVSEIGELLARFVCILAYGQNRGSHQFLNWWQQYATGILRYNFQIWLYHHKKITPNRMVGCYFWSC